MNFIKIQKVKSENKNQYINKDLIQSFYESDSDQTTVINFTSGNWVEFLICFINFCSSYFEESRKASVVVLFRELIIASYSDVIRKSSSTVTDNIFASGLLKFNLHSS